MELKAAFQGFGLGVMLGAPVFIVALGLAGGVLAFVASRTTNGVVRFVVFVASLAVFGLALFLPFAFLGSAYGQPDFSYLSGLFTPFAVLLFWVPAALMLVHGLAVDRPRWPVLFALGATATLSASLLIMLVGFAVGATPD